jgi:hypothetical protein
MAHFLTAFHSPATRAAAFALIVGTIGLDGRAHAAEGALSHYLPGSIGDFGIALVPEPGLQIANIVWW